MKRAIKIILAVFASLLLVVLALPFLIDANRFRPELESRLHQALGRDVHVGDLKLTILSGGVTAGDLSIADDPAFSRTPFVQAKSLHVGVDLPALIFSRKLIVTSITIDQPQIQLLQSPTGQWNFSSLAAGSSNGGQPAPSSSSGSRLDLAVNLVKVTNGRFSMGRIESRLKPLVVENVNIQLQNFAPDSNFPFSVAMTVAGGGSIKLDGKAGPINRADVAATPATLNLIIDQLDLAGSGLNETSPETAGLVSFDGSGQSGPGGVELKGKLKVGKLRLAAKGTPAARILEFDFHVNHDLQKRAGTVHQADVHFGDAVVRLTGNYDPDGDLLRVHCTVAGPSMPVEEVAQMLPALGVVLPNGSSLKGGTAVVRANIDGPLGKMVTTGSISITNTRLAGFNLSSKLSGIEKLAGIKSEPDTEIQEFSGNLKMAPEGINIDTIKFIAPALGEVSGSGVVNPDNTLDFHMQAEARTGGVAVILRDAPVPFLVDGTCSEPAFHPDMKAVVKGEIKDMGKDVGKAADGLFKDLFHKKK